MKRRSVLAALACATALAMTNPAGATTVEVVPANEARDFPYPGADTMALPRSGSTAPLQYITYGATAKVPYQGTMQRLSVPFTITDAVDGGPVSAGRVDGNAAITRPADHWDDATSSIWTPGAFTVVKPQPTGGSRRYFYLFYTALVRDGSKHCIGVAKATDPRGPFAAQRRPIACTPDGSNRQAIDGDVVTGPGGGHWLTWRNGGQAVPGQSVLSAALIQVDTNGVVSRDNEATPTPKILLTTDQVSWESLGGESHIENPSLHYDEPSRQWFLFYSGNSFERNAYSTGIAGCGPTLGSRLCTPLPGPAKAYFSFAPTGEPGFGSDLKADNRLRSLPGNKRGPGAMDVYGGHDGRTYVTWNYISDVAEVNTGRPRYSRLGRLEVNRSTATPTFSVTAR